MRPQEAQTKTSALSFSQSKSKNVITAVLSWAVRSWNFVPSQCEHVRGRPATVTDVGGYIPL